MLRHPALDAIYVERMKASVGFTFLVLAHARHPGLPKGT
jgi:hypothetical protein